MITWHTKHRGQINCPQRLIFDWLNCEPLEGEVGIKLLAEREKKGREDNLHLPCGEQSSAQMLLGSHATHEQGITESEWQERDRRTKEKKKKEKKKTNKKKTITRNWLKKKWRKEIEWDATELSTMSIKERKKKNQQKNKCTKSIAPTDGAI